MYIQTLGWCCTVVCRVLPALEFRLWLLGLQGTKLLWYKIEKYSLGNTTTGDSVYNIYTYIIYGIGMLSEELRLTEGYKARQAAAPHKQLDEADKNLLSAEGRL